MYTIIGSGFGLYGYLPALVSDLNQEVVLPLAYKEKIKMRVELAFTLSKVKWVADIDTALSIADTVIVAIVPMNQPSLVNHCLTFPNIRRFVLEKPLASSPKLALELLNQLSEEKRGYTVAYTLAHLSWQSKFIWPTQTESTVTVTWNFMAHHFANDLKNWKRSHSKGGGVLRFFGIHLIAMLSVRGYDNVHSLSLHGRILDEPEYWEAIFTGPELSVCHVKVNSRSYNQCFNIECEGGLSLLKLTEPFALENSIDNLDKRLPILARVIQELEMNSCSITSVELFERINNLWMEAEEKSKKIISSMTLP
jgi:hypothetical protein